MEAQPDALDVRDDGLVDDIDRGGGSPGLCAAHTPHDTRHTPHLTVGAGKLLPRLSPLSVLHGRTAHAGVHVDL